MTNRENAGALGWGGGGGGGWGGGGLVEQVHADHVVTDAGRGDDHGEQQAEGVGDDPALAAEDLLARVGALGDGRNIGGGLHTLRVHDGRRRLDLPSLMVADQAGKLVVQLGEESFLAPGGEVAIDSAIGREVVR